MHSSNIVSFIMFVTGVFSWTQIYVGGAIGLSELFVFAIAPFLFMRNYVQLRRDGFTTLLWLCVLSFVGCGIGCFWNDTVFRNAIRGYMANYGLWASIVFFHHYLRKDPNSFKWFLLGHAISYTLSTFWMHQANEVAQFAGQSAGGDIVDDIMSGPLFWASRIGTFWVLSYQGWYMQTPQFWNVLAPVIWGVIAIFISHGSGRSMALILLAGGLIAYVCGKRVASIRKVMRHFGRLLICAFVFVLLFSVVYRYTASRGLLGEDQLHKYESQVKGSGSESILGILIAGRPAFFSGLYCAIMNPLVGYGPWPIDRRGRYEDFMRKFASGDALEKYYAEKQRHLKTLGTDVDGIPSHSIIIQFWTWYGIFGLILWVYILVRIWRYMRREMDAVPQYIGYVAMGIPVQLWSIFFSPFGARLTWGLFLAMMFMCGAVKKGAIRLPLKMQAEIAAKN